MEKSENFKKLIEIIISGQPDERYASFDYCFNYFQKFREDNKIEELVYEQNLQQSCLQLGFYLASWGMYRGSTFLLQKSVRVFEPLMAYFASKECDVWDIDVNNYSVGENISKLDACEKKIREKLGKYDLVKANGTILKDRNATQTLTTKIMLGVFGNVPAFDDYFKKGMKKEIGGTFNTKALKKLAIFYTTNKITINDEQGKIKTIDFLTGDKTHRNYTKAKIVDMYGFIKGGGK